MKSAEHEFDIDEDYKLLPIILPLTYVCWGDADFLFLMFTIPIQSINE